MGKTSKPLTIGVDSRYAGEPWLLALEAQGHLITLKDLAGYDLILGPNCMRFLPGMAQFLDSFIKGARAVCYKKEAQPVAMLREPGEPWPHRCGIRGIQPNEPIPLSY